MTLMRVLDALTRGFAVVALALATPACGRSGGEGHAGPATAPPEIPAPTLRFADGRLVLDPARVVVTVPPPWAPWADVDRPEADAEGAPAATVTLRHPAGAVLLAVATIRAPGSGTEPTLRDILEDKRKKYGAVADVAWADERAAGFPVRTLAFTVTVSSRTTRLKLWMLGNDAYWLNFTCMAPAAEFAAREKDCRAVVDGFRVP